MVWSPMLKPVDVKLAGFSGLVHYPMSGNPRTSQSSV
jgi:hypothetical protein